MALATEDSKRSFLIYFCKVITTSLCTYKFSMQFYGRPFRPFVLSSFYHRIVRAKQKVRQAERTTKKRRIKVAKKYKVISPFSAFIVHIIYSDYSCMYQKELDCNAFALSTSYFLYLFCSRILLCYYILV